MGKGILIGILLHFFQIVVFGLYIVGVNLLPAGSNQNDWQFSILYLPFLMGFTQLLYMIPAIVLFWRNQPSVSKGIGVVTAFGVLMNVLVLFLIFKFSGPQGKPL